MEYQVVNNKKLMHFEIHEANEVAFLEYRYYKNDIAFMHTEVPESMGGRGVAAALARFAFQFAKEQKKLVMVYCPYVGAYLKKHPELKDQLDKIYHQ